MPLQRPEPRVIRGKRFDVVFAGEQNVVVGLAFEKQHAGEESANVGI